MKKTFLTLFTATTLMMSSCMTTGFGGTSSSGTIKGNVTKTQKGMGLMFDSTQITNLLQKEGKVSNATAVKAVSKLAKSADGARVGFELTK